MNCCLTEIWAKVKKILLLDQEYLKLIFWSKFVFKNGQKLWHTQYFVAEFRKKLPDFLILFAVFLEKCVKKACIILKTEKLAEANVFIVLHAV